MERDRLFDSHELGQPPVPDLRVGDLDHHRRPKLSGARDHDVVDVDLVLDLVFGDDPLSAQDLLNLKDRGQAVLEDEGDLAPDSHPSMPFELDDRPTAFDADLLVVGVGEDLLATNRGSHLQSFITALVGLPAPAPACYEPAHSWTLVPTTGRPRCRSTSST